MGILLSSDEMSNLNQMYLNPYLQCFHFINKTKKANKETAYVYRLITTVRLLIFNHICQRVAWRLI